MAEPKAFMNHHQRAYMALLKGGGELRGVEGLISYVRSGEHTGADWPTSTVSKLSLEEREQLEEHARKVRAAQQAITAAVSALHELEPALRELDSHGWYR
jgi:hypothetical protein